MADDEQPRPDRPGPPPAPRETPPLPSPQGGLPPTVPGESFDAEQWRRFQEFQEFKRFEEAHGQQPQTPPRRGRPLWQRVLRSKIVRKLAFLLVLLLLALWAYNHYFGDPSEDLPASMTGGGKTKDMTLYEATPRAAIVMLYSNVARNLPDDACRRFENPDVAQRFADHFNAPDCAVAVTRLHEEVTNVGDYEALFFPSTVKLTPKADGTVVVSSCALDVVGGPRLGELTLRTIAGAKGTQWTIADHRKEAADCR